MRTRHRSVLVVVCVVVLAGGVVGLEDGGGASPDATTRPLDTPGASPEDVQSASVATANGTLTVHFINVGQGASALVIGPTNETMLVGSGDWTDDGERVISYLEGHGVERIDHLVTTHADADRVGGHAAVIDHFETEGEGVGAVYDPGLVASSRTYQEYLDEVEEHDVTLYETQAGDQIPFEGVRTRVLSPPERRLANGDRNENSLVLGLGFGRASFLLPGDVESAGERHLVGGNVSVLNATVLSVPHHGSRSSSGSEFLNAVQPRIAVISSAYDSEYGHPHREVLERLAERSVRTYWTATHGDIRMVTNGSAVVVATQRDAPTDPLALRNATMIQAGDSPGIENRTVVRLGEATQSQVVPSSGAPATTTTPGTATTPETATTSGTTTTATGTTPKTATTPATAMRTLTTTATGRPGTSSGLAVVTVHEDASGDEYDNLDDEYVVFENAGDQPLDLSEWTVVDEAGHTYVFPSGVTLDPGEQVTLRTGVGTDTATDLYWGSDAPVWNNGGDTVTVRNDDGATVTEEAY
ncbi:lamin tail domain-containing protein [Halobacterium zhouii]|uniref:lamin tail domain-containing protein n=1 Tax=Halobacterium zhouii TaxID=2902624 RepID=UPI001E370EB5|nr:lamin tail domain-containing protein [Halobacterium zhouii]